MPRDDFDIVSDLNGGTAEHTISANDGQSSYGADAVGVNNQAPREPVQQARQVDDNKPAADKPLTLRDQISSALKGSQETPPAAQVDGGPARNPDGTFAPKAAAEPATPPAADAVTPPSAPPVAAPQGIDPAVFSSLPAETQVTLARTMDELNTRQARVARLEQLDQVISPDRREAWAMNGMTDAQVVSQLLALSDFAGRDPAGFIQYIAQQNGVDLEELVLGQDPVDPQYKALQDKISSLEAQVTGSAQQQQQAAHQSVVDSVVAFGMEKGADGQLLRPYFDELGNDVLPFISAVKTQNPNWSHAQVLQEAYDRACWGSPTVRAKMQEAVNTANEAQRLREQAERASKAREAGASVRSGAPTSAPAAPDDASRTIRDTIKAAMAQHS